MKIKSLLFSCLATTSALSQSFNNLPVTTQKPPLHGKHWMAVTGKPLAATAGALIFSKGGNAIDASCAMLAATCTMWDVLACNAWVERVISFTKTQVLASKIGVGIAQYGYDWTKKPAASLSWPEFAQRKSTVDLASGELVDGKARFSGAEAFRQKYQLATKLGVGSVAFWYCGSEDPAIWDFLPVRR